MIKTLSILSILFTVNSFGASSGTIIISGVVPQLVGIEVTPQAGYNNLDFSVTTTDKHVANVREFANTRNGYTVTVVSQNDGKFKTSQGNELPYSAKYDNVTVNLTSTPSTIINVPASNSVTNVTKAFKVSYTGIDFNSTMEGNYSDTLTFTISVP